MRQDRPARYTIATDRPRSARRRQRPRRTAGLPPASQTLLRADRRLLDDLC